MGFRIAGLDPDLFASLHTLTNTELAARRIERVQVREKPGAPCRVSLDDADVGEDVLLLSFEHQPVRTAYQQQGPIFVRARQARFDAANVMPPAMMRRTLSLRAFDTHGAMCEADLVEGRDAAGLIEQMFANRQVDYIHAHYAKRGCFAARIDRA